MRNRHIFRRRTATVASYIGFDSHTLPAKVSADHSLSAHYKKHRSPKYDVDLRAGTLAVRRVKGSMQQVQPLYQHRGQPLLDETVALRAWLRDRVDDGSGVLFTSQKGGGLHRSSWFNIFRSLASATGLPIGKRNPHVLKHSLASHLVAGHVNLALIRQTLGHRSIGSTMEYVHANETQAAAACSAALMGMF